MTRWLFTRLAKNLNLETLKIPEGRAVAALFSASGYVTDLLLEEKNDLHLVKFQLSLQRYPEMSLPDTNLKETPGGLHKVDH